MEVDITKKVQYLMKYGLVGLILIAVLCAGGIYYYQHQHKYFNVYDAQVTSSLVAAKVHGNAMITEKVVAEGEHVEAGDVIAHVQSTVTDEQIANLEQTVALSQRNLDEIKKGQTVTVAVPSPAPAPAASAPRSSGSSQSVASAESRMNRMNELFEMGAISAVQRDAAVSAYHAAVAAASSSAPAACAWWNRGCRPGSLRDRHPPMMKTAISASSGCPAPSSPAQTRWRKTWASARTAPWPVKRAAA